MGLSDSFLANLDANFTDVANRTGLQKSVTNFRMFDRGGHRIWGN